MKLRPKASKRISLGGFCKSVPNEIAKNLFDLKINGSSLLAAGRE